MMVSGDGTLAESPVPLALGRLQPRAPLRVPRGLRAHRPSLPLASLLESGECDDSPRRRRDDEDVLSDFEVIGSSPAGRRRASAAVLGERYTQLMEFDSGGARGTAATPRRASLAVTPSAGEARRSWAAKLQLERKKRRKSGAADDDDDPAAAAGYVRQKRPSWWNVLVPDNILKNRARRASQQLSRSAESIDHPVRRSKSRSVDHDGFAAPFDLDALRSKVEGRIEAVHRDEEEATRRLPATPPIKTVTYTVLDRDTLTSVAARFDTTPSELTKLNRLATPFIFSGQQLLVPDKRSDGDKESDGRSESGDNTSESNQSGQTGEPTQEKELLDNLRPVSPDAPTSTTAPRFLKINVRHITDGQGVVSGVLLVTPNAVMFDPNVSDTLVLEHGPESYGVIAPMEFVCNAAIFYDIAHMRTKDPIHNAKQASKAEIYYMNKQTHSPGKDSLLVKDETFPELQAAETEPGEGGGEAEVSEGRGEAWSEPPERGGAAFPKAFDRELVTPTQLQQQTAEERRRSLLDHHWAIPSKERMSIDNASEVSSGADHKEDTSEDPSQPAAPEVVVGSAEGAGGAAPDAAPLHLVKLSYHDSGIDIRDPVLNSTPTNSKKVYSDADIVLSAEWVPPVCIAPAEPPLSAPPLGARSGDEGGGTRKPASVSFSLDGSQAKDEPKGDKKNKMLKRLSYPLSWMEGLTGDGQGSQVSGTGSQGDSLPTSADSHNSGSVFSKVFNRRSSLGGFARLAPKGNAPGVVQPRLDYRSMVSVDDMPELFVSFDKLIPRPARPSDDPPLYLRLRMGRPVGRSLPRTTPLMSYGRKRMKPEYWFGIPRNRVDDLYKFLTHWVPELYGPLGDVTARGYQLIDSDTEWDDDDDSKRGEKGERSGSQGDVGDLTRESWEVLSMSDELRRALYSSGASVDMEFSPPDLIGTTEILTMEHREKICGVLPARAQGYMWSLVFSTSLHGFSLASMYRKMQRVDSPVLLVIQDTDNNVFGALTSSPLHPSEHFYGTGESLLFSFQRVPPEERPASESEPERRTSSTGSDTGVADKEDEGKNDATLTETSAGTAEQEKAEDKSRFRVWQWTGDNMYFIRGSGDNLSIGAGDGKFGLWLDGDLYLGRTQQCTTYGNEPLTTNEDFVVKIMECWAFI